MGKSCGYKVDMQLQSRVPDTFHKYHATSFFDLSTRSNKKMMPGVNFFEDLKII